MSENESDRPFMWYQNICSALFGFVTKHACNRRTMDSYILVVYRSPWTDEQTDRQNYDFQDRASTAASRGKHSTQ